MQNEKINQLIANDEVTMGMVTDALELTDDELELVSGGRFGYGGYGGYGRRRRLRKRIVISYFGRGYSCGY